MMTKHLIAISLLICFSCAKEKTAPPAALPTSNPFSTKLNEPYRFDDIRVHHLFEVHDYIVKSTEANLQQVYDIPKAQRTFDNTMLAMDRVSADFFEKYYLLSLLGTLHPDDEIKETSNELLARLSAFAVEKFLSDDYYLAVKEYNTLPEVKTLSADKQKYVREALQSLRANGLGLGEVERARMRELNDSIISIGTKFLTNIEDSGEEIELKEEELIGLSPAFIESLRKDGDSYFMALNYSDYNTYMRDVQSERGREKVFRRFSNRNVEENEELLGQILAMRKELAGLLGFDTYSDYFLSQNVLDTPDEVWKFLNGLKENVRQIAIKDYNELLSIKDQVSTVEGTAKIEIWNRKYYENILKKNKYQVDVQELSNYFEIYAVVNGIFDITEELFGVTINEVPNASKWHQDVLVYEIVEEGQVQSRIYLDLFSRQNKTVGEFAIPVSFSSISENGKKIPSMCLATNFIPPTKSEPTVLAHEEVVDLFTVFGFVLQHNFGEPELFYQNAFFSEKDFSFATTALFSNWAWEYDAVSRFARHYKTGKTLDEETFRRLKNTRNVGIGIETNNQILYAAIDLTLHHSYNPSDGVEAIAATTKRLENEISLFPHVEGTNLHTGFSHLSDYGSNYYMYLLSEVYGKDMFSVFEDNGIFDQKTGKRFRDLVLKKGVSEDEYEMIQRFLGREPNDSAYINSLQ